jgi:hypothetical protein
MNGEQAGFRDSLRAKLLAVSIVAGSLVLSGCAGGHERVGQPESTTTTVVAPDTALAEELAPPVVAVAPETCIEPTTQELTTVEGLLDSPKKQMPQANFAGKGSLDQQSEFYRR